MPEAPSPPGALVADDSASVRNLVSEILRAEGYDVVACADGEEALSRYRPGRFAIVILDLMMPRMTGLEAVQQLRARGETVPVLIISSYLAHQLARPLEGLDAVVTLQKPFALAEFRDAVRRARGTISC